MSDELKKRQREREAAKRYWKSLDNYTRGILGDALVLGDFDWRDWFHTKPSRVFMNQLGEELIYDA